MVGRGLGIVEKGKGGKEEGEEVRGDVQIFWNGDSPGNPYIPWEKDFLK